MSTLARAPINPAWTANPRPRTDRCKPDCPAPRAETPGGNTRSSRPRLAPASASTPVSPRSISFRGAIRRGPHAGLILSGTLRFTAGHGGHGHLGELISPDGARLTATRVKITGRAVTMTLTLPDLGPIHASGAFERDPVVGMGILAGVLTGPDLEDLGDWQGVFTSGEPTASRGESLES